MPHKTGRSIALAVGLLLVISSLGITKLSPTQMNFSQAHAYAPIPPPQASQQNAGSNSKNPYSFWKGTNWLSPTSSFDNSMNVTFTAVANSLSGLSSTDWISIQPINMAYGSQTTYTWIQFVIRFDGSGSTEICLEENQWANNMMNYGNNLSINPELGEWCTDDLVNKISVPYTVGDTYKAELFPTDNTHVEFSLTDDTTGGSPWTQTMPIPSNNVLYNTGLNVGYSPATMMEGYTDGSSTFFPAVPNLELDVANYMQKYADFDDFAPSGVQYYAQPTESQGNYWKWEPVAFAQTTGSACIETCTLPSPTILQSSIQYPTSIALGQTAQMLIQVENEGAAATWMTAQISFPGDPPASSISIDQQDTTVPGVQIDPTGYQISSGYGFRDGLNAPMVKLSYPMVEGVGSWTGGTTRVLEVDVTPTVTGTFKFEVKTVAGGATYEAINWDPTPFSTNCTVTQDQQNEYSCLYSFTVSSVSSSNSSSSSSAQAPEFNTQALLLVMTTALATTAYLARRLPRRIA